MGAYTSIASPKCCRCQYQCSCSLIHLLALISTSGALYYPSKAHVLQGRKVIRTEMQFWLLILPCLAAVFEGLAGLNWNLLSWSYEGKNLSSLFVTPLGTCMNRCGCRWICSNSEIAGAFFDSNQVVGKSVSSQSWAARSGHEPWALSASIFATTLFLQLDRSMWM